ncbi:MULTISPECIES: MFS transporter [unclassified Herbaspirillum]|uniref:MFS transporter n=1 Tax=unclassified Herbaspirillum TaxID=2624150 RepID=UPI000E2F6AEF|nr:MULTISPECIES: MFS transporter [unclassified Herbaspirillum]RFB67435.1 MFS transporter [Herbaspirillum sp. 3R-3a1]TFI05040.1 MFS transporter [Herbaspirillum sp. 3R11]TFI12629.1 MFS transporter [Herbaspirillum sp. 3R-11]TFI22990.1 MFS transporter [Herbaspirillum sp. 3C11]
MNNTQVPSGPGRLRSIIGGSAGNVIEWYDFLAYSIFSIYFSKAFFPGGNLTVQLLNAAAIASVGYVVRPLGSWLIGTLADRYGRRLALSLSVAMMSAGSLIIALTPTYASIGIAAPAILVFARLLQGFSMGGEAGTSATYLSEMAPPGRRGFFVGFVQVTVVMGQLLALGLMLLLQRALLTAEQLDAWGWRIPFFIGGLLAIFAMFLRRGIAETDAFVKHGGAQSKNNRESLLSVLLRYRREVIWSVGISIGGTVAFYTFTIYLQKYMVNTSGFSRDQATLITTIALLIYMVFQPLYGLLSDMIGRRKVMMIFGIGGTFLTIPIMHTLGTTSSTSTAFLLNLAALGILSGFSSIHWLVKSELFPAKVRALGVGLPFAIVTAVMGGTTEFVALRLKASGHEPWFFYYASLCAAISLITYIVMPETRHTSTIDREAEEPVHDLTARP